MREKSTRSLLEKMRNGGTLSTVQQLWLVIQLSIPAIMANISSIIMEYIDASMVGHLGASESAAIGLVASSTWLVGGLCSALDTGFSVQVAHRIGAGREKEARALVKQGLVLSFLGSVVLLLIGVSISKKLPLWLGGEGETAYRAYRYFFVFSLAVPIMQVNHCAGAMLQSSGNMKVPSVLHILMCFLDVAFNLLFIFPSRTVRVLGQDIFLPGAGMGVTGAALGTALAELVIMMCMLYFLLVRSPSLHFRSGEKTGWNPGDIKKAAAISFPVAVESFVMNGAQIVSSRIVAPLGTIAIAANSFSVTAESLCYMPGYGIGQASTTLIGQSVGAGRGELARKMGLLTTGFAMAVMAVSGAIMYLIAPWMIGILSPDEGIRALGAGVLRIEAFAEPMYGASIVASGVFRGAGDTLIPSCLNFCSMWLVRIPLAALLSRSMGLKGVWIAMCLELWVRGALFLCRLFTKKRW